MDFHPSHRPVWDHPRPTLQVITAYPPTQLHQTTSNYSYPLSASLSPGRESVGSDISSVPSMVEDHGSDISTEDEYQYQHNSSRSGGLCNCFWNSNNTHPHEKEDFQMTNSTPATRPISHHAGTMTSSSTAASTTTPERKKSHSRPTALASSRPDSGFAQDNTQWPLPLTPPYTSHSSHTHHQTIPRTFSKPLPTSTYSLFPPTPPSADSAASSVPPPRRSSLARPWTSDTLRLEQTPPSPVAASQSVRPSVQVMCGKSSLGRKRKHLGGGGEPMTTTVCSPSPRPPPTSTTASLVFRARPSIIPVPSSTTSNQPHQMTSFSAYHYHHKTEQSQSSLYPQPPHLIPNNKNDFRRPSLTNLRRNSHRASIGTFPRPPSSRDHHHPLQQTKIQGLEERPLPPLPRGQRPERPPRSSPCSSLASPAVAIFPVPPTSPLPPLRQAPPPPSSSTVVPEPPVVSVFETDSDDEESDSDSSADGHHGHQIGGGAGGVVESFARRLMRSLLGSGSGSGHTGNYYRHDGQPQSHSQSHQRSASDYSASSSFYKKAIHLSKSRPRSTGNGQLDVQSISVGRKGRLLWGRK